MKVIVTCAGSGGHINPAIAIANIIKNKYSDAEILFIGTENGMENDLVKNAGYNIVHVLAGKLHRRITLENIKNMYNAYLGYRQSKKILKEYNPDLVIGTGGYICVSVMKAAAKLKIPYILHESNSYPGLSIKLLAKKACKILCGFEKTCESFNNSSYTGTPTKFNKKNYLKLDKSTCLKEFDLPNKKIVFVTFGSLGAKYLNPKIIDLIATYKDENVLYILVTGNRNYEEVLEYVKETEKKNNIDLSKYLILKKFVFEMDKMYKVADVCITRCGAMTITELIMTNNPAILIPLAHTAENYQYHNGKIIEDAGSGYVIEEKDLSIKLLHDKLYNILDNDDKRKLMRTSLDKLYIDDVIFRIEKVISDCYGKR